MNTVLVFAPHFDDESIGCGGAIAKHMKEGDDVSVVFMTSGNSGSISHLNISNDEYGLLRKAEAEKALNVLGVIKKYQCLQLDEGFMNDTPELEKQLVALIRRIKPNIIYTTHEEDAHNDHRVTGLAVTQALYRVTWKYFPELGMPLNEIPEIRFFEVWTPLQKPNFYVDISELISIKEQAINCYYSQLVHFKYHHGIFGLNQYRGIMGAGVEFAEAFRVEKLKMVV